MTNTSIGFIGGGNMATSLIAGLIADGWRADNIHLSEPDASKRELLSSRFSIRTYDDNQAMVANTSIVVLAVKPQIMASVCEEISNSINQYQPLVLSIAAGIQVVDLSRWLGGYKQIVRTMPNTPSMVQSGATALFSDPSVNEDGKNAAETIMRAVGLSIWVETEDELDAVTALSGSGPAYFFYIMEAMEKAGIELGLAADTARLLSIQTAFGAAKMALESTDSPSVLRHNVTSPGGTTERALSILKDKQLEKIFSEALAGACTRSKELADELGKTS